MADYKLIENGVFRRGDGAFIPADPANRDWAEYQEWLVAGNSPDPEFTAEELAARAARAAEAAAVAALSAEARADAVFDALKTATGAQINDRVNTLFPLFTPQQRATMKIILHTVALVLRRG